LDSSAPAGSSQVVIETAPPSPVATMAYERKPCTALIALFTDSSCSSIPAIRSFVPA
jgi:hypothetical protein